MPIIVCLTKKMKVVCFSSIYSISYLFTFLLLNGSVEPSQDYIIPFPNYSNNFMNNAIGSPLFLIIGMSARIDRVRVFAFEVTSYIGWISYY